MFTSRSITGRLLNHALHHQHARIYNFDRSTQHGVFPSPSIELTNQFLDFVHYDEGGRIFTYVLTLDGRWRFTETGKEFGIDMLSKHTMHSDVSIYIAYSGEFFVRRVRRGHRSKSSLGQSQEQLEALTLEETQSRDDLICTRDHPSVYELVIDNDSGTYRPNGQCLPLLQEFLSKNLPGLRIRTIDSQADAEVMSELKTEQRNRKNSSGRMTYLQFTGSMSSLSSLSSSDEERLREQDEAAEAESKKATKNNKKKKKNTNNDTGDSETQVQVQ